MIVSNPRLVIGCASLVALLASAQAAADWPLYRSNVGRTAYTSEKLAPHLQTAWTASLGKPQPAWPRSDRMNFDFAPQPVIAQGLVLVGSTRDDTLYALELDTGAVRWIFTTQGPIRFAPAVSDGRVFVGSDDGYLYALDLKSGAVRWKRRGGPDDSLVLGNGRAISKWPVRGGVTVHEGHVYFAAGIWPSDGIYLYALDAATGAVIWCNDQAGAIYMGQPHGGAYAESGVAAQGYLVIAGEHLLVPTGRAVPAVFNLADGKFKYFHLQKNGQRGGALTMAVGDVFFNSGIGFDVGGGSELTKIGSGVVAASDDRVYLATPRKLTTYEWADVTENDRRGNPVTKRKLVPVSSRSDRQGYEIGTMAVAGDTALIGSHGTIETLALSGQQRSINRAHPILGGIARGLAISDGRVVFSTDSGQIACLRPGMKRRDVEDGGFPGVHGTGRKFSQSVRQLHASLPPAAAPSLDTLAAVKELEEAVSAKAGFAVDLEPGDGQVSLAIAQHTPFHVIAFTKDPSHAEELRGRFHAAGYLGHRISVWVRDPAQTRLPNWCADLVVSGRGWSEEKEVASLQQEAKRLQRPYGGIVSLGNPATGSMTRRGPLAGAGSWTHQYADAANTLNSGDTIAGGELTVAWYRDIDFDVPQRHGRGPAPLFAEGRLIHEGLNGVIAVNAYNGSELWRYQVPDILRAYNGDELMGTAGTGSNMCLGNRQLYLRHGSVCDILDASTGERLARWWTPKRPDGSYSTWGYLATDGKRVYGSEADPEHIVTYRYINRGGDMSRLLTESKAFFALDAVTGKVLWRYHARDSIRHNAIAVANDRVFLIDRPQASSDRVKKAKEFDHPLGILRALDAATGDVIWESNEQIFGTALIAVPEADRLIMAYQPTRFRLDSERGDRIAVFRLSDGKRLWDVAAKYDVRPFVRQGVVYTQGKAWDLDSGKTVPFPFKRSYGCGILAASERLLVFRSATLGYFNLDQDDKVRNYGGMRPGCWINALPVGGMVVVPDASAGCRCSYLNQSWIALQSSASP